MKTWRTNIGLRLTSEIGQRLEAECQKEIRPMANFIEYLVTQEYARRQRRFVVKDAIVDDSNNIMPCGEIQKQQNN